MAEVKKIDSQFGRLPDELVELGGYPLLPQWSHLVATIYGYASYSITSSNEDGVSGVIVLTHIAHPIFGNYLCSAPYGSFGGVVLSDPVVANDLLKAIEELASQLKVEYVNLRFVGGTEISTPSGNWHNQANYVTFRIDLTKGLDQLIGSYSSNHRNHIRKSQKKDLTIRFGSLEIIDEVYEGLALSMHELGSPYHQKKYIASMIEEMGESVVLSVIYKNQQIAGAGVFIKQGDTIINLHANVLREFRSDYVGEFFYWKLIEHFKTAGFNIFDLGRSLIGSGNDVFKSKWEPQRIPCQYWYLLKPGQEIPSINQKNPKFRLAIEAWKHMPSFLVRWLGPYLIKGIA